LTGINKEVLDLAARLIQAPGVITANRRYIRACIEDFDDEDKKACREKHGALLSYELTKECCTDNIR
jgi:hypothetical protein